MFLSTWASVSVRSGEKTPISCVGARDGFVRGPRMLNIVRMPISFLGPMAYFMALCSEDAKRKHIPMVSRHSFIIPASADILIPSDSSTSALPHLLDTERLPCLATAAPAPEATNAAAVEMLNVPALSPPVPHVSTT